MEVVLVFTGSGDRSGFEYGEICRATGEVGGILVRNFRVPKIGFVSPRTQPEALLECGSRFVRKRTIVQIDPSAWNLAAIFEGARCGKNPGRPARATRWWRRGWRRCWRRPDDSGWSRCIASPTTTATGAEAQRTNANRCGEQPGARSRIRIKIGGRRHRIPLQIARFRAVWRLCRTVARCNALTLPYRQSPALPVFRLRQLRPAVPSFESGSRRRRVPPSHHRLRR